MKMEEILFIPEDLHGITEKCLPLIHDPLTEMGCFRDGQLSVQGDFIAPGDFKTGMAVMLDKSPVIGEDKQPFALFIQASDITQIGITVSQVVVDGRVVLVAVRTDITRRFIKLIIGFVQRGEFFPIHADLLIAADKAGVLCDTGPVHRDLPLSDEVIGPAA
jgi:hypothetical protein